MPRRRTLPADPAQVVENLAAAAREREARYEAALTRVEEARKRFIAWDGRVRGEYLRHWEMAKQNACYEADRTWQVLAAAYRLAVECAEREYRRWQEARLRAELASLAR